MPEFVVRNPKTKQLGKLTQQVCCLQDIVDNLVIGDLPLVVGESVVDGGTSGKFLYDNGGVLGEKAASEVTQNLDNVLSQGGALTVDRIIDLDGNGLTLINADIPITIVDLLGNNILNIDAASQAILVGFFFGNQTYMYVDNGAGTITLGALNGVGASNNFDAASYSVGSIAGAVGGTFTNITSITVVNGIVTDIQGT